MLHQNLIETLFVPELLSIFLNRESKPNAYNGDFSNVNNEINVTNVRN